MSTTSGMRQLSDPKLRILLLSASAREGSLNTALAKVAAGIIESFGADSDIANIGEFTIPFFDQRIKDTTGIPTDVEQFSQRLETADGFIIASPEYNHSFPAALKNLIDWVSLRKPQPFFHRHTLLISASPSVNGGNRGLWSLRVPLESIDTMVFPDMFSLSRADTRFDPARELTEKDSHKRLEQTIRDFLDSVEAAHFYPILKQVALNNDQAFFNELLCEC